MAKRRTKEDVAWNEILLSGLVTAHGDGEKATVSFRTLVTLGWKGSMPYCTPMAQGNYLIKQNKRQRGLKMTETKYFVMKLF